MTEPFLLVTGVFEIHLISQDQISQLCHWRLTWHWKGTVAFTTGLSAPVSSVPGSFGNTVSQVLALEAQRAQTNWGHWRRRHGFAALDVVSGGWPLCQASVWQASNPLLGSVAGWGLPREKERLLRILQKARTFDFMCYLKLNYNFRAKGL